eukprot:scaffold244_cov172-Amphora_coffeaeformis.AAC.63
MMYVIAGFLPLDRTLVFWTVRTELQPEQDFIAIVTVVFRGNSWREVLLCTLVQLREGGSKTAIERTVANRTP